MASKSEIDRLGARLRRGALTEADLRELDVYRRSFADAYSVVFEGVRAIGGLVPSGRPAKSTTAIVEKLRRESIRLSQIQDIAGCRVVVDAISIQDSVASQIEKSFDCVVVVDRRQSPSHGYRAVHLVVTARGKPVEVQLRTKLQHLWAEMSEKFADEVDHSIKYGGGDPEIQKLLVSASELIARLERMDSRLDAERQSILSLSQMPGFADDAKRREASLEWFRARQEEIKTEILAIFERAIALIGQLPGASDAVPD